MVNVVVIGAGPYGLSVAAHLRGADLPFRIFGEPLEMWRQHMPKGMLLKSDAFATNLSAPTPFPLSQFCQETSQPYADVGFRTPLATIIEYGQEFQRRYVGAVEQTRVASIEPDPRGYNLQLSTGETVFASKVIIATGLYDLRRMPDSLSVLPSDAVSHTADHSDLSKFTGQRVTVIGGGQSAVETAALLHEQGVDATLVSRRPILWFAPDKAPRNAAAQYWRRIRRPYFGVGPGWRNYFWSDMAYAYPLFSAKFRLTNAYGQLGPAGSDWTHDRVVGVLPTHCGLHSIGYHGGKVHLTVGDGRTVIADHVIAATGYQADISRLAFLQQALSLIKAYKGVPVLDQHYQSVSAKGLYFVGYLSAPTFGPSMRFVYGTRFAARRIVRHIAPRYQGHGTGSLLPKPA